jgi:hypothetical protein
MEAPVDATAPVSVSAVSAEPETQHFVAHAAAGGVTEDDIAARVEEEMPAAAEAVAQETAMGEAEHHTIAQAVHRVMERMKENLVEEIVRELRSKK